MPSGNLPQAIIYSEKDYDILFASIDIDGYGTLDFAEFSVFFAAISSGGAAEDFNEASDNFNEA